jgi:hypothetical protein
MTIIQHFTETGTPTPVSSLIDQIFREWLEPPSDQAPQAILADTINSNATVLNYLDTYLAREERFLLAPGSLIELDSELIRIGTVNESANTISVLQRGAEGTEAVGHDAGAPIKLHPRFPRKTVFDAVVDAVMGLFPPLYAVAHETVTSGNEPVEVPADFIQPISALVQDSGGWFSTPVRVLNPFPSVPSGKAVYFPAAPSGKDILLTYRTSPRAPVDEAVTLEELGVRKSWHRIIKVDVVLEVASNVDIDRLSPEFVASKTDLELTPVLAASEIRQRLIAYREYLLDRAASQLEHEFGPVLQVGADRTFL